MNRNEFIKKSAVTFVTLNTLSVFDLFSSNSILRKEKITALDLNPIDTGLTDPFQKLVQWLKDKKWEDFLLKNTNLQSINWSDNEKLCEALTSIKKEEYNGFDDFGGNKLIEPGNPSLSLLYHALASPRVKDSTILDYPTIDQLDILENFIYASKKWDDYFVGINEYAKKNLHLMVLAYEYRPAYKTPAFDPNHKLNYDDSMPRKVSKYAQLVFSRTGIARIGNQNINYDKESRCFTNKPIADTDIKQIAVTPARYGLFLVELVEIESNLNDKIKLMNYQNADLKYRRNRFFIRPIRKIFSDKIGNVEFAEYHLNEKLYKLTQFELDGQKFEFPTTADFSAAPFKRINCTNDSGAMLPCHSTDDNLVSLTRLGDSVLLSSTPNDLVRFAKQNNKPLYFKVPPKWEENNTSNRRYSAFKVTDKKTKEVNDVIWTEFILRERRRTTRFRAPKNAPLFLNIKYQVDVNDSITHIANNSSECTIDGGNYNASLFEDSICDGSVSARITFNTVSENEKTEIQSKLRQFGDVFPAFSLVTAPDFFPYSDSNDIRAYYSKYKHKMDSHFLEGGSINLSGIRQRGNPQLKDPYTGQNAFKNSFKVDKSFDTLVAVVSNNEKETISTVGGFEINFNRDYKNTSFLPDTGTGIFFPGWEVTYSTENKADVNNPFLATVGLGSPFPEDMKLCAAANGMWPVASPDAGRTFQGSLKPFKILGKPSTSVPLMDDEIGIHANSPHAQKDSSLISHGWDGEQGPYLVKDNAEVYVNFTDVGRADYVANILDSNIGFDMSKLRELDSREIILRMECLRIAILKLTPSGKKKHPERTKYWLVSAEKVNNWSSGANAYGIPDNLIGNNNHWAKSSDGLNDSGYLFAFAKTVDNGLLKELENPNSKRRNQIVKEVAICKIEKQNLDSNENVKWIKLMANKLPFNSSNLEWRS